MKNNKKRKIAAVIFAILLFYIFCGVILPLFRKEVKDDIGIDYGMQNAAKERIRLIDDNTEALLWRLRLIENAKDSIIISTFELREDNSGKDIMAALNAAANRGVKVKILVDGISGQLRLNNSDCFRELTSNKNVEAKIYNKINLLKPWKINYRMHDKYLIADDSAYILGGRNTYDLFLGNYTSSRNEDLDILVFEETPGEGNSYRQLMDYFNEVWQLDCCKEYKHKTTAKYLDKHYADMKEKYTELQAETDYEKETIKTDGIALLSNPVESNNKAPVIWKQICSVIETADEAVIVSPYIVLNKDMYKDIQSLSDNGVNISFITNAYEKGANPFGCTDYINEKNNILACGVKVYEYWYKHSLHSKAVLAGDDISIVGSFNMDMRSTYLDTELMLCIKSKALNEQLRNDTKQLMDNSKCVQKDTADSYGNNYEIREISRSKKVKYEILRRLIRPIRQLL